MLEFSRLAIAKEYLESDARGQKNQCAIAYLLLVNISATQSFNFATEANFDGLVGMTHNYAGLAAGNMASQNNAGRVSKPKAAALQGVAKMQAVAALGVTQCFFPPQERPALWALRAHGFTGSDESVLAQAHANKPHLLAQCCSSSFMWSANAATVAPAQDTRDQRTHVVVANLKSMAHRSIEPPCTHAMLNAVFTDRARFEIHPALAANDNMGDEGAANHTRLFDAANSNQPATHFFVYGMDALNPQLQPKIHPARQTLQASQRVAEELQLNPAHCVFAQQNPAAIDQGVFHNDVVAVGNASTLLYHQDAWLDHDRVMDSLAQRVGNSFCPIVVSSDELTIAEAVTTYLFNSQLITTPDGSMTLVCPSEVEHHARASAVALRIQQDPRNSISRILYMDVRESMRNGGGPACLRLRVPLAPTSSQASSQTSSANILAGIHAGCVFNTARAEQLRAWIERWYPDQLTPEDLADPQLLIRNRDALDALTQQLGLAAIYPFQGVSHLES